MNPKPEKTFLERYESLLPIALFLVFLAFTLPGIAWGPWHPDEIVVRSIKALYGEWKFSEINFNYPDLPQYAMYFLGRIILALGYSDGEILIASRVLSAVLAGATIPLTYMIVRRAGGAHHALELSASSLMTPPNFGSGAGNCLPSIGAVAPGEPMGLGF